MKKRAKFLFVLVLFCLCLSFFIWFFFVRVSPDIYDSFIRRDIQELRNFFLNSEKNWYQKSLALEFYALISCHNEDRFLQEVLKNAKTEFRRAVFVGCYKNMNADERWILTRGLEDSYSYNRFITLEAIENLQLTHLYKEKILELSTDHSSMVSTKAKNLAQR